MNLLLRTAAALSIFAGTLSTVDTTTAEAQMRGHPRGGGGYYYRGGGGRHWGRVGGGIAAGIAGAVILNEVARPRYYYYSSGPNCPYLEARCDAGAEWACDRLDRDPRC